MKLLITFLPLILAVSAGSRGLKTTLEDIERDYITTQKGSKLTPPPVPKIPAKSPTQFGFVPAKTITNYSQQEPKPNYYPQYQTGEYQQYHGGQEQAQNQHYLDNSPQKYSTISYSTSSSGPKYTGPSQKAPQTYYVPLAQSQHQNFENVQYVGDNSIAQHTGQKFYTTPQYVYLQQYQAPSTSVESVVEPKKGSQYLMYLPTYPAHFADQAQNHENLVYTGGDDQTEQTSYQLPQEAPAPTYTTVEYSQKEETAQYEQPKSDYTKAQFVVKREPKSLLDSYVPSVIQLQYYKQAQQNAIRDSQNFGKYHKNSYRTVDARSSPTYYGPSSRKH